MSLIVAKKQNNQIYIVSDTKLTNPNNLNRIDLVAPEEFSAIKIVNINPFVSISFAGEISYAKQAIATCRKLDNNINRILDYLLQTNITSNNATEFIVCINLPTFFIYEIKNSKITSTNSTWIGDIDGFNEFQKKFAESDKKDILSKMEEALNAVIESNVQGINGFLITVTNESGGFCYKQYMKTYMPSRTYTGGGSHVIEVYGTVQEGGYTINLFSDERNEVLCIHIRQNRYGLVYLNKDNGYLEPLVHKDVDEHELNEITEANYGIKPPFIMSSKQNSYFERGNKAAASKHFERAIKFYDLGLKETDKNLIASLYFNKGVCQFHLRQFSDSALSFHEAVKVDTGFHSKVFNFTNQFRNKM